MRRYWFLIVSMLAVGFMSIFMRGFVREGIIIPIFRLARFFQMFPREVLWFFFLGLAVYLAAKSQKNWEIKKRKDKKSQTEQSGRIRSLAAVIKQARQGTYSREKLARNLGELTLQTLAYQERRSLDAIKDRLRKGTLDVPPDIFEYLQAGLSWEHAYHQRTGRWPFRKQVQASPLDLDPHRVIEFIESVLEVSSDVNAR
ncbi:MAG: hypothetical protein JRD68_15315 [Deltaproteobacteria bacterium]|nr:hypothetical protein [Deltaproteobacteria bacterium]